ncbi:hypothetical protein EMIHUDRAFT_441130 [Emiliania huxleyi CCMP1516]|uniref:Uncharacterized protein n=2 Tax=Emiliania huxleyi TaxID=2903 RepID=A0A0D3KGG7_EMIH1|nr:hypothetical protein EMIHUDRAFT_441130 [Emiliania huxleyi CCMP1516]EOD34852.1 hypothetical protein EMIHUDRAFT_441130 [Emiliania huxleyi CCMP1516]|eukprot:XP_005787281.1 hypothetical protein EMIHUDRAFT_441130 [Emiliania huxleyi CCMP1516]
MQVQQEEGSSAPSPYDEFLLADVKTGERSRIGLDEKEKLYLDCLDAFYNDEKPVLGDSEYETLKTDLQFEGSRIAAFSKDEIKYLIANKRFVMGKPFLSDSEYDSLRRKLKTAGSPVVLHEAPSCKVDGTCRFDMKVDEGKQRLLYLPGTLGGLILACEVEFWTLHIDPLLSIVLGALPAYLFGVWFTENIFAQKPLVASTACPSCNSLLTVYFGDLFGVQRDGIMGPAKQKEAGSSQVGVKCPDCTAKLIADRTTMRIESNKVAA